MPSNLIAIIDFDQDEELSEEFYQIANNLIVDIPVPVRWQQPTRSLGAIDTVIQVLGSIDYTEATLTVALGVISNALYNLIKSFKNRNSNEKEKVLPVEIIIERKAAKVVIRSSMSEKQVKHTINNVVNAILKKS